MTSQLRHIATEPANLNHKVLSLDTPSPRLGQRHLHASDSDLSLDTASLSQESQAERSPNKLSPGIPPSPNSVPSLPPEQPLQHLTKERSSSRSANNAKIEWEILEGLRDGQRCEESPVKFEGFLLKRRKWPMKGWHKRYFILDKGILIYAKNQNDMARGKLHGSIDVGLSVISTKARGRRIDIDADECIYHLKVKMGEQFSEWVQQLRQHRLHRQHQIAFGSRNNKVRSPAEEVPLPLSPVLAMCQSDLNQSFAQRGMVRSPSCHNSSLPQSKVAAWLAESSGIEQLNKDLTNVQQTIFQLNTLLEQLKGLSSASDSSVELPELCAPTVKKDRKRGAFLRRKKANKGGSADLTAVMHKISAPEVTLVKEMDSHTAPRLTTSINIREMAHLSTSNPNLPTSEEKFRPHSLPEPSQLVGSQVEQRRANEIKLREEFVSLAKGIHSSLRSALWTVNSERERLRQVVDSETNAATNNNHSNMVVQQNSDLRARLQRIHAESEINEASVPPEQLQRTLQQSMSYESSSVLSVSEYFDAAEYLGHSETSSEASLTDEEDDGSFTSENSEAGTEYTPVQSGCLFVNRTPDEGDDMATTGRRTRLPCTQPDKGDFNLWNLLCKNIGKDLSKVCMPVTLNEPLNTLQRLCEEMEYCELLDRAAEVDDLFEQMVYVAAFAVSGYGSLYHRASHKPFNPLLGETYECVRDDKGFRFLAEQVSHHPPVTACYVEAKNYTLWQDLRIKTTFWGKSMEIQPIGCVNLLFTKHKTHYKWNKVTTCIHNVFSGQRWVDQYGELCITNGVANCKLIFVKTSYWSNKRHEVRGTITNKQGKVIHNLFGHWNEGLYCGNAPSARCIWRPAAMPEDYKLYYGFTQFAIELNDLNTENAKYLPPTDTRLRPDQRLLEEGDINNAETAKLQLEQFQRDRKKKREESSDNYDPMWFKKRYGDNNEELWDFNGLYWQTREAPGFSNILFPQKLW